MGRLQDLHKAGVSIWLDTLSRELLETGQFKRLVQDFAVTGGTSNPTIFAKAITSSDRYDTQLRELTARGVDDARTLFLELALEDIRQAAEVLRPTYERTLGADGFISLECTPDLADDTDATIEQALELWSRLDLPNALIKVPATSAGIRAVEELTVRGVSVNVTLLFSLRRYEQMIEAYLRGLERRARHGGELGGLTSVASFFVSRVDTKADPALSSHSPLRGRIALANAKMAYDRYLLRFSGPQWERLEALGARRQRPLWASTGTKNPTYSDVLYVEQLIASGVINTMPDETLRAFRDHGRVEATLDADIGEAKTVLAAAAYEGLDLDQITTELEREGIESFCGSYRELLRCIETRMAAISADVAIHT